MCTLDYELIFCIGSFSEAVFLLFFFFPSGSIILSLSNDTSLSADEGDSLTVCIEASAAPASHVIISYTLLNGTASPEG